MEANNILVQEAVEALEKIDDATDEARFCVESAMIAVSDKVSTMQKYGMEKINVGDPVIQEFVDSGADIYLEYENDGPKKINKKLLGTINWVSPPFKRILKGIKDGTINHQEIDKHNSVLRLIFGNTSVNSGSGTTTIPGQGIINVAQMKRILKKAKKTNEYSGEDLEVLNKLTSALENWKTIAKYDRADRTFFDRFIAYTHDTRTMDKILDATQKVCDALDEAKNVVSKHYRGSEE